MGFTHQLLQAASRRARLSLLAISALCLILSGCGFHLQTKATLAPPLRSLCIQSSDPYSFLTRTLKQALKSSNVTIVDTPQLAKSLLVITSDTTTQDLIGVSGTQQTRQYNLKVTVTFQVDDNAGRTLVPSQSLTESRTITTQSNQILGSSNEANLLTQQMHRALVFAIINRLASHDISKLLHAELLPTPHAKKS